MNNSKAEMAKNTDHITSVPRIIGGMQQVSGSQSVCANGCILTVSGESPAPADTCHQFKTAKPFESEPDVFVGDTASEWVLA